MNIRWLDGECSRRFGDTSGTCCRLPGDMSPTYRRPWKEIWFFSLKFRRIFGNASPYCFHISFNCLRRVGDVSKTGFRQPETCPRQCATVTHGWSADTQLINWHLKGMVLLPEHNLLFTTEATTLSLARALDFCLLWTILWFHWYFCITALPRLRLVVLWCWNRRDVAGEQEQGQLSPKDWKKHEI